MVDSRDKGARAETVVRDKLRELTKLKWERTPGSGALDEKHGLKGDLYIPGEKNIFCVEVKHYAEDHLTSKVLTVKDPQLLIWWEQAHRQGIQVSRLPLLIFKFDRSKIFVAYEEPPCFVDHFYIMREDKGLYVSLLEDWVQLENPKFVA